METMDQGDVIIRPSSKGENHLTVTWKVNDGIYQHVDVREEGKENAFSLGSTLWINTEVRALQNSPGKHMVGEEKYLFVRVWLARFPVLAAAFRLSLEVTVFLRQFSAQGVSSLAKQNILLIALYYNQGSSSHTLNTSLNVFVQRNLKTWMKLLLAMSSQWLLLPETC